MGLATAWALRQHGAEVRIFESGAPGGGQSAGESRIFRHAHDDARLARFVSHSRQLWRTWSEVFGQPLISPGGAIAIGPGVPEKLKLLDQLDHVPTAPLNREGLQERFPLVADYSGPAMVDLHGGTIHTLAAIDALTGALRADVVHDHVLSVRSTAAGAAEVRTGTGAETFDHVVLCAGRGTAELAHGAGLDLPVQLSAHVRLAFAVRHSSEDPLPTFQDGSDAFGESGVYGAPSQDNRRYSIGLSDTTRPAGSRGLDDPAELNALTERTAAYVRRALPGLDPTPRGHVHCWVTTVPWGDDGVGAWSDGAVTALAGHNLFKQAPALGEALAEAALTGVVPELLRPESHLGAADPP